MDRLPAALLMCLAIPLSGCAIVEVGVRNPVPGLERVAVVPFFNLSQERSVDGREFALAYYSELQKIPGFEVLTVGVTERAALDNGLDMSGPEDAIALARILNVDAVVVGAVTDFDAYNPRIGLKVAWYSPHQWLILPNAPAKPQSLLKRFATPSLARAQSPDSDGQWVAIDDSAAGWSASTPAPSPPAPSSPDIETTNVLPTQSLVEELDPPRAFVPPVEPQQLAPALTEPAQKVPAPQESRLAVSEPGLPAPAWDLQPGTLSPELSMQADPLLTPPPPVPGIDPPTGSKAMQRDPFAEDSPHMPRANMPQMNKPRPPQEYGSDTGTVPALMYDEQVITPAGDPEFDPHEPLMAYVRIFDSTDRRLVSRLSDYLELSGESRSGDLEAWMQRTEFFRKFTAHVMISEMLTLHGGEARRRLVLKPREYR